MSNALEQADIQMSSIAAMVVALNCDYDRLEFLRDYADELDEEELVELEVLEQAANGCESEDEVRERIEQDALEVMVRSEWYSPGETDVEPDQFYILLCSGGSAVRIMGELNEFGQPDRAWLEYQDWGTPWTGRTNSPGEMGTLIAYAECFYFGD